MNLTAERVGESSDDVDRHGLPHERHASWELTIWNPLVRPHTTPSSYRLGPSTKTSTVAPAMAAFMAFEMSRCRRWSRSSRACATSGGTLVLQQTKRRCTGALGVLERERRRKADIIKQAHRLFKVLVGLTWESNDEVG